MKSRTKAIAWTAAAAAALVVTAAAPSGAAAGKSYAYGFSVNGQGKQPYVESTDGSTQHQGGHIPDSASPLLSGGVVDLSAGNDKASVDVVNLSLLNVGDQLPQQLKDGLAQLKPVCDGIGNASDADTAVNQLNDAIDKAPGGGLVDIPTIEAAQAFCNSLVDGNIVDLAHLDALRVQCTGDSGTVRVAGAQLLGADVPGINGDVPANTPLIPRNGGFDVTLNRQTPHGDGSFTVDGMVIDLGGGQGEIVLASATCGKPITARQANPTPTRNAPAPAPVHRSLAVTG